MLGRIPAGSEEFLAENPSLQMKLSQLNKTRPPGMEKMAVGHLTGTAPC
jgi:hypothetical protein